MRGLTDSQKIVRFMRAAGLEAILPGRIYLTGGSSAVLLGWRSMTIDIDVKFVPEQDALLRALPAIKKSLDLNVELASPGDFIPELPGWEARSRFIQREERLDFFHYDFYAQCLSKIERSHVKDLTDIRMMIETGIVETTRLLELFALIEPDIYRYPALDAGAFRGKVEAIVKASS